MIARLPLLALAAAIIAPVPADAATVPQPGQRAYLTAEQMFMIAEIWRRTGDDRAAEAAYRALASDRDIRIRAEARFRLGKMLVVLGRLAEAGLLFRQILDEQPKAQPVRIELAQVLDLIGDEAGARRTLREAQAGGLPPHIARLVDRYSAALRAQRQSGATLELTLAPDSNINGATSSDTLSTVLGDFTLDDQAKQRSGIGTAMRAQAYWRTRLGRQTVLLLRTSAAANLYKEVSFNDVSAGLSAGPELQLGRARATAELGISRRWFGGRAYSTIGTVDLN
jgi:tetratricopeptide (TPR) repeat protein